MVQISNGNLQRYVSQSYVYHGCSTKKAIHFSVAIHVSLVVIT